MQKQQHNPLLSFAKKIPMKKTVLNRVLRRETPIARFFSRTCAAVDGDSSALDEYLLLAANAALEWRRMGKPTPPGPPATPPANRGVPVGVEIKALIFYRFVQYGNQ